MAIAIFPYKRKGNYLTAQVKTLTITDLPIYVACSYVTHPERGKPSFYDEINEQNYLQMQCVLGHIQPQTWQKPKMGVARKLYNAISNKELIMRPLQTAFSQKKFPQS